MDLVPPPEREALVAERTALVRAATGPLTLTVFATSIWDESLYRAWSSVVHALIPNVGALAAGLAALADACEAYEVALFDRRTFLVIAHARGPRRGGGGGGGGDDDAGDDADPHRFEKISSTVKSFQLACAKAKAQLTGLRAGSAGRDTLIAAFTASTFILVVAPHETGSDEATLLNISVAKPAFETMIADL